MRPLLFLLLLPLTGLLGQADSLLQAYHWEEEGTERRLLLTADGTFELDYGPTTGAGRYLLGRYTTDSTGRELTLSVDYFLGKSRLPGRYRRGQDFYLQYDIITLNEQRLVLLDVLTDELLAFLPGPLDAEDDPAQRHVPQPNPTKFKLPRGWGG